MQLSLIPFGTDRGNSGAMGVTSKFKSEATGARRRLGECSASAVEQPAEGAGSGLFH